MNKTTIKISVLAFLGFMTYGYAQQQQQDPYRGKVGVNTVTPSATMDVQPNSDNARVEAKTNEGIIAPKLSKTRIANIETPVEGTLVYATDDATSLISAYTGNDPKVAKITEKGYYFYNGTEWVKAGSDANDQLWAQRNNNGVIETYLKPADGTYDCFSFNDKGDGKGKAYVRILGETNLTSANYPPIFLSYKDLSINYELFTSKAFPFQNQVGSSAFYDFHHRESVVEPTHIANTTSTTLRYNGGFNSLRVFENLGKDINYLNGQTFIAQTGSPEKVISQNVTNMVGSQSGVELFTIGNVNTATGLMASANNWESGNIGNLVGARITATNEKATVRNQESLIVVNNLNSGNISNIMRGINLQSSTKQGTSVLDYVGISHRLLSGTDITNQYIGIFNSIKPTQNLTTTIKNFFGYRLDINRTEGNLSSENAYGLHMDDIDFATGDNFAIYTKAGQIRFGDLANTNTANNNAGATDKPVFVTADGVLKVGGSTGATQLSGIDAMPCNDANRGKMNFIKDVQIAGGGTADAFGICLKSSDGNFYWRYLYGGTGVTNLTGNFGENLD